MRSSGWGAARGLIAVVVALGAAAPAAHADSAPRIAALTTPRNAVMGPLLQALVECVRLVIRAGSPPAPRDARLFTGSSRPVTSPPA